MTISITAKDKDTFPVVVQTTSTTTHTVTISDPIHINLTGGSIPKEAFCLSQKNSIKPSDDTPVQTNALHPNIPKLVNVGLARKAVQSVSSNTGL